MSDLTLNPDKLKAVRKDRKLIRSKLAKLAGLTERQVAYLEGVGTINASYPEDTLHRLATALQVTVDAITGEGDPYERDLVPPPFQSTCDDGMCGCC